MRVRLLLALGLLAAWAAAAQTNPSLSNVRSLSLRETIDLALSRNLDLRIEHLTVDIAGYSLNGAYGVYSPLFIFRAQHNYVDQPGNFDPKKAGQDFPYQLTDETITSGLTGNTPIGFSYDLSTFITKETAKT